MKRTLVFLAFAILAVVTITSCASSKDGCKSTQGLSGYSSRYR